MEDNILIEANKLLTPRRIDLVAKYIYIESYVNKYNDTWAKRLYEAHIEAFSGGNFTEPNNPQKNSIDMYEKCFNELIENIKNGGLDSNVSAVPVSADNQITDGAHRTSVALYYNLQVPVKKNVEQAKYIYDYRFFRNQLLDEKYLQFMAYKYILLKPKTTYIMVFYPSAMANKNKVDIADRKLREIAGLNSVVYYSDIHLNYNGLINFMIQAYQNHEWIGTVDSKYKGIKGKADPCYNKCEKMRVYVIDLVEEKCPSIVDIKSQLRNIFGMNNHSVHSSDNPKETILLAKLLLNNNSIHLLNNGNLAYDKKLNEMMTNFNNSFSCGQEGDIERYIIDSSAIMGLYGIRQVRDLDYLTVDAEPVKFSDRRIENHGDEYLLFHNKSKEELIFNPENHLYSVYGIKLITLEALLQFKKNRSTVAMPDGNKDAEDIRLIESKLSNTFSLRESIINWLIRTKRLFRNEKTKFRDFLQNHGIFVLTKVWHFIRGKGFR